MRLNLKKRIRRRILLVTAVILLLCLVVLYCSLLPYVRAAVELSVINTASDRLIDAVNEELYAHKADFADMILYEKDANGSITAVQTNTAAVNLLKADIMSTLSTKMLTSELTDITVPLGNVIFPNLFIGQGPLLPVRITALASSDSEFSDSFSSAGINQTLQKTELSVRMELIVYSLGGRQDVTVSVTVPVMQTVIVGSVPQSFVNVLR